MQPLLLLLLLLLLLQLLLLRKLLLLREVLLLPLAHHPELLQEHGFILRETMGDHHPR